jgi:SAM-dependent methyltransferase
VTVHRTQTQRNSAGATFAEADVVRCYAARPPYAPAAFAFLLEKIAGRARALDLGCGPGKIALTLADHFGEVVALDPSDAMIAAGRAAREGRRPNITWVEATAEAYDSAAGFDLVTAGTSIHWPDHAVVFPKLARWTRMLAVITGDAPRHPPCDEADWIAFHRRWLAVMAQRTPDIRHRYDPVAFAAEGARHEAWMDIEGRESFAFTFEQSVEDFVTCQHSRATWSREAMGEALAAAFDEEMDRLVRPYATAGRLSLALETELTWGTPRSSPR